MFVVFKSHHNNRPASSCARHIQTHSRTRTMGLNVGLLLTQMRRGLVAFQGMVQPKDTGATENDERESLARVFDADTV